MNEPAAITQHAHDETNRNTSINLLDLQILAILRDDPLWKKQVATQIDNWGRTTINRRIDRLHDTDLLQSKIITGDPDEPCDLYIAFETTDAGCDALQTHLVCTEPGCDDLKPPTAHVHEYVPAQEYF